MSSQQIILIGFVFLFTAFAAVWDVRTGKLPNWLTIPAFVLGILFHVITGTLANGFAGAGNGLLFALGGFVFGFAVLFVLWLIGGTAAGDVKMMGALGAWLGFTVTFQVFIASAFLILLGLMAVAAWKLATGGMKKLKKGIRAIPGAAGGKADAEQAKGRTVPFGVPLAVGDLDCVRGWHCDESLPGQQLMFGQSENSTMSSTAGLTSSVVCHTGTAGQASSGTRGRRRGVVNSVELLLLLPLLVIVLFGSLQLSFLFAANHRLNAAAQAACRVVTLPIADAKQQDRLARQAAEEVLGRRKLIENYELKVERGDQTGDMVRVELRVPMRQAAPNLVGNLLAINDRNLHATAVMRKE